MAAGLHRQHILLTLSGHVIFYEFRLDPSTLFRRLCALSPPPQAPPPPPPYCGRKTPGPETRAGLRTGSSGGFSCSPTRFHASGCPTSHQSKRGADGRIILHPASQTLLHDSEIVSERHYHCFQTRKLVQRRRLWTKAPPSVRAQPALGRGNGSGAVVSSIP